MFTAQIVNTVLPDATERTQAGLPNSHFGAIKVISFTSSPWICNTHWSTERWKIACLTLLGPLHGKVLSFLMKAFLQTNLNLVHPWKITNHWRGCGCAKACNPSKWRGAEAGGPGIPEQAKVHSKTLSQNKKEGVHINWRPDYYFPWCSG